MADFLGMVRLCLAVVRQSEKFDPRAALRKKLEANPANPEYILTDSYIGYRFREP